MEQWEKRMNHDRSVCDALAESRGEPKPQHPEGGVTLVHFRVFNGPEFFEIMGNKGHDYFEYKRCKCSA